MAIKRSSVQGKTPLNPDALAKGATYAMEQAWCLLRDAVLLIQNRRYASSLVVATFCLEQLGRAEIYRQNAKQAFSGKRVTPDSMGRALTDHLPNLIKAQIPVTASIAMCGEPPTPGSEAAIQLGERLEAIRKINEPGAPYAGFACGVSDFFSLATSYADANILLSILQTRRSKVITMASTSNPANTSHHFRCANIVR